MEKFLLRAWLPDEEIMLYSDQDSDDDLLEHWTFNGVEIQNVYWSSPGGNDPMECIEYVIPNQILMLSTGMYDREKEKLFEGDIITNGKVHKYVIVWFEAGFYAEITNRGQKMYIPVTSGFLFNKTKIGNIYQTPELCQHL